MTEPIKAYPAVWFLVCVGVGFLFAPVMSALVKGMFWLFVVVPVEAWDRRKR